jgi:HEPN domain-containing protein
MKDETRIWITYADENLEVSALALQHGHRNACLQNAQQAVEKYLTIQDYEALCPEVNRRTLQRDLKAMLDKGILMSRGATHHQE